MTVIDTPLPQEDIEVIAEHQIDGTRVIVLAVCYPDSPGTGHFEVHAGGIWLDEPFFTEPTLDEIQERLAQERLAQERLAQERLAQERLAQERLAHQH